MLSVSLDASAALARLDAMPHKLRAALAAKCDALRAELQAYVRDEKLSGQALHARSGALRRAVVSGVAQSGDAIGAWVGVSDAVAYAAIQEFGGKTAAHEIVPNKARALAFVTQGRLVFARRVQHPGSILPERSYLRSALAERRAAVIAELTEAAVEGMESS